MTLKRKNNHSTEFSVLKLGKNEILHKTSAILSKGKNSRWPRWQASWLCPLDDLGGGHRVVVSTAAFHARVRGSVPGLGGLKETKNVSSPSTCESQYYGEPP